MELLRGIADQRRIKRGGVGGLGGGGGVLSLSFYYKIALTFTAQGSTLVDRIWRL